MPTFATGAAGFASPVPPLHVSIDAVIPNRSPNCNNRKGVEPSAGFRLCTTELPRNEKGGPRKLQTTPLTNRLPICLHRIRLLTIIAIIAYYCPSIFLQVSRLLCAIIALGPKTSLLQLIDSYYCD